MGDNKGFIPPEAKKETVEFVPPEVKKKGETSQRDLYSLSRELGKSMSKRGEIMARTQDKPTKSEIQQENELLNLASQPSLDEPVTVEKEVTVAAPEEQTYQQKLGIETITEEPTQPTLPVGLTPEERTEADAIQQRLKEEEDAAVEDKATSTIERAFIRSMQTEGRRGIPIEEGDIPKTIDELSVLEGARQNYNMELEMKMEDHLDDNMKAKAQLVQKERDLWESLKSKTIDQDQRFKTKQQLIEINKQLQEMDFDQKLFDPVTGETVDKEKASPEAAQYEVKVVQKQKEYESDIQKAYNVSDRVLHKYDLYNDQLDEPIPSNPDYTYRDLLTETPATYQGQQMEVSKGTSEEEERALEIKEKWIDAKADAEAVSRAIMLNEDPAQIERGLGGDAGFWEAAGKGFMEGVGAGEKVTGTEGDFATRWVKSVREAGEKGLLTEAQVKNIEMAFTEKVGYGMGVSVPIMAEIMLTTVATEGAATAPVIARRIKHFKDFFSATKSGRLFANTAVQAAKGYVAFAPTEETGATGIGEGAAQGIMDTWLPEKLLGGKYGKLLNAVIRVAGGATGETIQEVSGQYFEALSDNGYNATVAFEEAFGRTPEERWETLAVIGTTSLLFSGAFNIPRLAMTQEALQTELDAGNIPEADMETVQEIINEMGNKLESEGEAPSVEVAKEPIKTEEDAIQEPSAEKIPVQPETKVSEEVEQRAPEPEVVTGEEVEVPGKKEEVKPEQAVSDVEPSEEVREAEVVEPEVKVEVEKEVKVEKPIVDVAKTKKAIIKEVKELPVGTSTIDVYNKVKEANLTEDPEIKELVSEKAKEFKDYQKRVRVELGLDEDIDAPPFQKKSTKETAGKKYLGNVIKTLQKSVQGVEVEFDSSIEGVGTIREGKVVLNPEKVSVDTPIHEFAHVWTKVLKAKNNRLHKTGITLALKNKELMDYIKTSRPDLTTDEAIAEEVLVTAIGEKGSEDFNKRIARDKTFRGWIEKMWKNISRALGIKKSVNWREASEMTLKDFTKLASGELLNETPITSVTVEDVKNIMSEKPILDSIAIDSEILTPKGQDTIGKAKEGLRGVFRSAGKLPKWVANLDNNTQAAVSAIMSNAARDVISFNKSLKEHIKKESLSKPQTEKLVIGINDVLTGDQTVNALGLSTDEELAMDIAKMRNNVDNLSKTLVDSGYLQGDIITTINENLGAYMRRSYEIHKQDPKTSSEWVNKLNKYTPGVVARAKEFIATELQLSDASQVKFKKNKDGSYKVTMVNEYGHETKSQKMSREDLVALVSEEQDEARLNKGLKAIDQDKGELQFTEPVSTQKYGVEFVIKEEDIDAQVNNILDKHLTKENAFGIAGMNKKDISILKKRKDIPPEIRDLLGEIKDPVANYMETMSKMASLIEYSKFLSRIKKEGEGTLVWFKENRPKGLDVVQISKEKNARWAPLDGMYTSKEFLNALEHYEKDALVSIEGNAIKMAQTLGMYLNTLTKTSLTKWNIPSNFRNHYGAIMMAARAGYVDPIGFGRAYADFWKGVSSKDAKGFDRAEFEMMKSYGLIDDSVGYQTYKDSLNRAMKNSPKIKKAAENFTNTSLGKIANAPREFMDKAYLAPDAAAKMFLFRKMKVDYAKAYPNLTEEQLNEKVADIVKDVMPTYSKMSKGARILSRNPFIGAFASFTTETVRNYANQIELIQQETADYKESKNPHLKKLIQKKVAGLITMTMLVPTIATALRLMVGIDDEEDEALRSVKPPWEKNSWTLYLNQGKDGTIVQTDLSYIDPLSVLTKPAMAVINGALSDNKSMVDAGADAVKEIRDQFMGEEPLYRALVESFENEDSFGKPIARPLHNEGWKRAAHIVDVMKPKFIDNLRDAKKAYWDEKSEEEGFGKKYDPATYSLSLLGLGVRDRDIIRSVKFKIGKEIQDVYDAKNIYKYSDTKDQKDLDKANVALAKIFKEHYLNIQAARVTGASEFQIQQALNQQRANGSRYIPKYWADQLYYNQFLPLTPANFEKKKKKKKIKITY